MSRYSGLTDLVSRKRALVEQSETQRQLLATELHHLRLSAVLLQRRLKLLSTAGSVVGLVIPLIGAFIRGRYAKATRPKEQPKRSLLGTALSGWRLYRKVAPVLHSLIR